MWRDNTGNRLQGYTYRSPSWLLDCVMIENQIKIRLPRLFISQTTKYIKIISVLRVGLIIFIYSCCPRHSRGEWANFYLFRLIFRRSPISLARNLNSHWFQYVLLARGIHEQRRTIFICYRRNPTKKIKKGFLFQKHLLEFEE